MGSGSSKKNRIQQVKPASIKNGQTYTVKVIVPPQVCVGTATTRNSRINETYCALPKNSNKSYTCIFCGKQSDIFRVERQLERHYWESCPMLIICKECNQILEKCRHEEHLLVQCKSRNFFRKCDFCEKVIHIYRDREHAANGTCKGDVKVNKGGVSFWIN